MTHLVGFKSLGLNPTRWVLPAKPTSSTLGPINRARGSPGLGPRLQGPITGLDEVGPKLDEVGFALLAKPTLHSLVRMHRHRKRYR
jgi:hypothetical protein